MGRDLNKYFGPTRQLIPNTTTRDTTLERAIAPVTYFQELVKQLEESGDGSIVAATGLLTWLGLTAREEDRTWNAFVGVDQHSGLDGEPGIA